MKKKITSQFLVKEYHGTRTQILFSVFVILGIIVFLCPLLYLNSAGIKNCLLGMLLTSFISIPFCVLGLKYILEAQKRTRQFKNGEYEIVEDFVTHKQMVQHGSTSDTSDSYCQISFFDYSEKTGKAVVVTRKEYDKTKKGDRFYMVYVEGKLLGTYPQSKYEL